MKKRSFREERRYSLENTTRQWIWSGCLWSDPCNTRVFFLPGKENTVWPRESPKVYSDFTSIHHLNHSTDPSARTLLGAGITEERRVTPALAWWRLSGPGTTCGRKTLERKCHRDEATSAKQEEHSGRLEQHTQKQVKMGRKPTSPQVPQAVWWAGPEGDRQVDL